MQGANNGGGKFCDKTSEPCTLEYRQHDVSPHWSPCVLNASSAAPDLSTSLRCRAPGDLCWHSEVGKVHVKICFVTVVDQWWPMMQSSGICTLHILKSRPSAAEQSRVQPCLGLTILGCSDSWAGPLDDRVLGHKRSVKEFAGKTIHFAIAAGSISLTHMSI